MSDENKQLNKPEELKDKATSGTLGVSVFKDNPSIIYLHKKTEKLISAVYLLSGFISDKEPVKWQLREVGMELLSQSLSLSDRSAFVSTGLKILSFLEIAYIGGVVSEMNYNILKHEFKNLIQTAEAASKESGDKGFLFSEQFFETPTSFQNHSKPADQEPGLETAGSNKGQKIMSDRLSFTAKAAHQGHPDENKSNRQEAIIDLLKKNPELGIKDFVGSIHGCSEKTIQRELAALVSKGLIKKAGEKRWSRYSLK